MNILTSVGLTILFVSESVATFDIVEQRLLQSTEELCCDCPNGNPFSVLGKTGPHALQLPISIPIMNDDCDIHLDTFIKSNWEELHNVSDMEHSLVPNGLELLYSETDSGPTASIPIKDITVDYKVLGFRILVPGEHTLSDKTFEAELQILHKLDDKTTRSTPLFVVYGFWVDVETTASSNEENTLAQNFDSILRYWQTAVDLREALCTEETTATTATIATEAPRDDDVEDVDTTTVVGRGDEQNFDDNPIRKLDSVSLAFAYNAMSSHYTFEQKACNNSLVLWNLATMPVEISIDQFSTMKTLLDRYKDPTCETVAIDAINHVKTSLSRSLNTTVTKVCPAVIEDVSNPSSSLSLNIFLAFLAPLATMILI